MINQSINALLNQSIKQWMKNVSVNEMISRNKQESESHLGVKSLGVHDNLQELVKVDVTAVVLVVSTKKLLHLLHQKQIKRSTNDEKYML